MPLARSEIGINRDQVADLRGKVTSARVCTRLVCWNTYCAKSWQNQSERERKRSDNDELSRWRHVLTCHTTRRPRGVTGLPDTSCSRY